MEQKNSIITIVIVLEGKLGQGPFETLELVSDVIQDLKDYELNSIRLV